MKKIILFFLLSSLSLCLFAQNALQLGGDRIFPNDDFTDVSSEPVFDIGLDSGMLFGMLYEWVFKDVNLNQSFNFVLSRLEWQLDPLFYIGFTGAMRIVPRFFIGVGGWIGIPAPLGFMEDRDWNPSTGVFTIFSHHDNVLISAQFADINLGYSFVYENSIILNGILGFNLKRFDMSGRNGWQEVPPGTVPPTTTFSGQVINYELNFFIPYVGTEVAWRPFDFLTIDSFISISPFLTFIYARDMHILTGDYFLDFPQFGFSLTAIVSLIFHLGAGLNVRIKNFIQWTPPAKGMTYKMESGTDYFITDPTSRGGAGMILYGLSLSLNFGI